MIAACSVTIPKGAIAGRSLTARPTQTRSSQSQWTHQTRRPLLPVAAANRLSGGYPEPSGHDISRRHGLGAAMVVLSQLMEAPEAEAFGRDFPLEIESYEVAKCGDRVYVPKSKGWTCLNVKAKAKITGKDIEAADVFGFVTDADNSSALAVNPDGTSRTVVAGINKPLKGGGKEAEVDFTLVVSEKSLAKPPLKFKGFKMEPSISVVEERFAPFSACEIDPSAIECDQ